MSQTASHPCPQCGTLSPAGQQFCSNCGITLSKEDILPTERQSTPLDPYPQTAPPPPPPYNAYPQQGYQPPGQSTQPPPASAKPQKDSSKSVVRQIGCGVVSVILLIVVLLGTAGCSPVQSLGPAATRSAQPSSTNGVTSNPTTDTTTATQGSGGTTPNSMTEPLNLKFTYSSIDYTITSAEYANSFPNDSSATSGVVRVNFKEDTTKITAPTFFYSDVARLIPPNGATIAPSQELHSESPALQTSDTNWIDFALPPPVDLSKLVLQMGTVQQSQMKIPLNPGANLSQYAPKTITPNTPISYGGLNWTLISATVSWSANGDQAPTGMRSVTLSFRIDNPTSQDVTVQLPNDYMRLKSGDVTNAPTDYTFPSTSNANTTNVTGLVFFLMPENDTAFTLEFLQQSGGSSIQSSTQVNTNFHIP